MRWRNNKMLASNVQELFATGPTCSTRYKRSMQQRPPLSNACKHCVVCASWQLPHRPPRRRLGASGLPACHHTLYTRSHRNVSRSLFAHSKAVGVPPLNRGPAPAPHRAAAEAVQAPQTRTGTPPPLGGSTFQVPWSVEGGFRVTREDTLLRVSRRTEDTPKIHRDLLMRVPRRSGVSSYEDTRVPGRSGVSSRTALNFEDTLRGRYTGVML